MGLEFEPLSHRIIEAAIKVHRELGPGFIESIYHRAMEVSLQEAGLFFETGKRGSNLLRGRGRRLPSP
jgi:GxxExxY protein